MQRVDSFPSVESAIASIMEGLSYYIDCRGEVKTQGGRIFSYSISFWSSWLRNSDLTLDRVLLASDTILKLDKCNGDLAASLDVINAAINLNKKFEKAHRDRPYSTSLERSHLHRLLLEAKEILEQFQASNAEQSGLLSAPVLR